MSRVSSRKVGKLAGVEPLLPVEPPVEQLAAPRIEPLVQLGEEIERAVGQDSPAPRTLKARQRSAAGRSPEFTAAIGSTQIE